MKESKTELSVEAKVVGNRLIDRLGWSFRSDREREAFVEEMGQAIQERCGVEIAPKPGESLAVSVMRPKTAALAFDRVYRFPTMDEAEAVPGEVGFYGATYPEMLFQAVALLVLVDGKFDFSRLGYTADQEGGKAENERRTLHLLCSDLGAKYGSQPTVFFHNQAARQAEMPSGPNAVLRAAITDLALVDEETLSWEQVLEFRKDVEARMKYRRLMRWIDGELQSHSPREVGDLVALRLDDYEWVLRKHGISTLLGTITSLIDPKFIGAASAATAAAALSADKFWGALMGLSIVIGKAAVTFGTAQLSAIQERRSSNYEVAYVHEIKRRFGEKPE